MVSSSAAPSPLVDPTIWDDWRARTRILVPVFLAALALSLAVSWENLADPFVRHDDYPAAFWEPDDYYWKATSEGRWLNYWYIQLRLQLTTQTSFLLYLSGWSLFAAAFAAHTIGPRVKVYPGAHFLLAGLIVLCPQSFDIGQWFNTLVPGIWVLAVYAVLTVFLRRVHSVALLFLFVPLSFLAYNTYPLYLLALLTCRVDHERSLRDLVVLTGLFVLSFGLAMACANTINWLYGGYFGIEVADWRAPNEINSLADIVDNGKKLVRFWQDMLVIYGMGSDLQGYLLGYTVLSSPLVMALLLLRRDRMLPLYALTPVAVGLGLLMIYQIKTGIVIPSRTSVFFWLVACFLMVFGIAIAVPSWRWKVPLTGLVVALMVFYSAKFVEQFRFLQLWQTSTVELARQVPPDSERIVIYGRIDMLPGARQARIQTQKALAYRLRFITGHSAVMCIANDSDCTAETPPFDTWPRFESLLVETVGGVTYIRLPEIDLAP